MSVDPLNRFEKGIQMTKKLMLLATGALTALALAVLPAIASAGEFVADCSSGATCAATVTGGAVTIEDDSGGASGKLSCTAVGGTASQTSGTSTGSATLTFTGCKDEALSTSCTSAGQAAGTIKTNALVSHLVFIDATAQGTLVGVLFTGFNVTYSCAGGLVLKTVTGNLIGQIEAPECNKALTRYALSYEKIANPGSQKYKQVTTTGTVFDLTSGSHSSDATTTGIASTTEVTFSEGKTATLTC